MNGESKDIEAFILAGGNSTRMGSEKGLVTWHGKSFVEHILGAMQKEFPRVTIITNTNSYEYLGVRTMEDHVKGKGPLGGIYTGLRTSHHELNFFASCDIPFITYPLIHHLVKQVDGVHDIVVPVHDGVTEPLFGIYHKRCMHLIGGLVKHDRLSVRGALRYFNVKYVDVTRQKFYTPHLLANINSKSELKHFENTIHEHQS